MIQKKTRMLASMFMSVICKDDFGDRFGLYLAIRFKKRKCLGDRLLNKFLFLVVLNLVISYYCEELVAVETPAPAPAPALGEPMDIMTALQLVLRKSRAHGGLAKGLHEGAKVIEKHAAQLCVLAEDCDQPDYVKLVKALCADHNVNLITVPSAKTLGEWAGLCKIDSEGKARKVVGCGCVVVKDFGEETEGLHIVQEYVKSH
ncbi:hypothetical protein RND71_026608 [Anisodus tanguticus]|uniref:40S ribosomal protein S12 n=1 Tax=Anisodus tanguticus TaxID=243964 RepID=A0AAE1VAN5_9SOLA|nr:hypothetical protein RND71_026608 [Anisodus tanguticus]